jgi:hypothetical protein
MALLNNDTISHSNIQYLNDEYIFDMSPLSPTNQPNYLKENNLTITNTFIDFTIDNVIERAKKLRRTKSLELIIDTSEFISDIVEDTSECILDEPILKDTSESILEKSKINKKKSKKKEKKKFNKIIKYTELLDAIMIDVDLYIIKRGIYDVMKEYIDDFKKLHIDKINSSYSDKKADVMISCMNKYIDNTIAIYLSNIRNKLYLDIVMNFEKLNSEKTLHLYVDETLVLVYKNTERKISRQFSSYIKL